MKTNWVRSVLRIVCAGSLLCIGGTVIAEQQSEMEKRMIDCAATTATDKLGECLSAKGAPAVSATDSEDQIHAAVVKCAQSGVTGTTELGSCVNSRLDKTGAQPVDVTDAQIQEAARLCSKHYTETDRIAVCVKTSLHSGADLNP